MKIPVLLLLVSLSCAASAQYYYNDIVVTGETNSLMQSFRANKVKMATATGYDANGVKTSDFSEVREMKEGGRALKITSRSEGAYSALYNRFDEQSRLVSVTDSSSSTLSTTTYQYDAAGRIVLIQNTLRDSLNDFNQTEIHQWIYNAAGKPEKMWRTINGSDSLEVKFNPDEHGNPGEEVSYKGRIETDRVYYYFDDQGRLTDIVRYNKKVKKLLPDMIFTYDESGKVIQLVKSSDPDNLGKVTWFGYFIWRYLYNENGLKTKEALFNNEQQMTGKIEYRYNFSQ